MSRRVREFFARLDAPPGVVDTRQLQRPLYRLEGLAARPWHARRHYPWTRELEDNAAAIREELSAVRPAPHPEAHSLASTGAWQQYLFYRYGERFDEHCAECPRTAAVVDAIPGADSAGLVYFSVLGPKTRVAPHAGPTNLRIRCQLPLVVPEGGALRVGSRTRHWKQGQCLVFDDSFVHEANNPSDQPRIVLIVDVWHPDLSTEERIELQRGIDARLRPPSPPRVVPSVNVGAAAAFADVTLREAPDLMDDG